MSENGNAKLILQTEPQPAAQINIVLLDNGELRVASNITNPLQACAILAEAIKAIASGPAKPSTILPVNLRPSGPLR